MWGVFMYVNNPEIKKDDVIYNSITYWNPSKTEEWLKQGIDFVIGKRYGYFFEDMNGERFFDIHLNGGTYNLGHRNPEIVDALTQAATELDVGNHHFPSITKSLLAKKMAECTPGALQYTIYSTGGGEAVDVAIKTARYTTKKRKIISLSGCYHGHTGLAVCTGDMMFRKPFLCEGSPNEFEQVPFEDIDAMEYVLKKGDVAAVIVETIPATYGFPIPKAGYLKAIKNLCEKYDALYIADEVQTGLMRTGKLWGIEHENVEPDMLITAKGFGGGMYPIAATVVNERCAGWLHEKGRMHGSTCGGADIGCAVSLKVLEICTRPETVENVKFLESYIRAGLERIQDLCPDFFVHIRQRGVILGLEFDYPEGARYVMQALRKHGVWAIYSRLNPRILQFKLGLLADKKYCDELLTHLEAGILEAKNVCLTRC